MKVLSLSYQYSSLASPDTSQKINKLSGEITSYVKPKIPGTKFFIFHVNDFFSGTVDGYLKMNDVNDEFPVKGYVDCTLGRM